jgi:hypothetical protein
MKGENILICLEGSIPQIWNCLLFVVVVVVVVVVGD